MDDDCNVVHKKFGHHSRDETRKIAKDKFYTLIGSWKSYLGYATSKVKQRNLTSGGKHKVTWKTGETFSWRRNYY